MYVAVKGGERAIEAAHRLLDAALAGGGDGAPEAPSRAPGADAASSRVTELLRGEGLVEGPDGFDAPCALCGAEGIYLDEIVLDDVGGRMLVCPDTDHCASTLEAAGS